MSFKMEGAAEKVEKKKNIIIAFLEGIIKLVFNKAFYVIAALLAEIVWFCLFTLVLTSYSPVLAIVIQVLSVFFALGVANKKMNPSYKLVWCIIILAIPVFGVTLYLLLGSSRIQAKLRDRFEELRQQGEPYLEEQSSFREVLEAEDVSASAQSRYITVGSGYPVYGNTDAQYFQVGDEMFPVLVQELEKAEKYIFIEYFIINDGVMWQTILDILEKKAAAGVDVRLIYDSFGCMSTLPIGYAKKMREKGIKCEVFNRFRPILNVVSNNRDHRKICVIDGKTGFTGGINLSDEYINKKTRFGYWKDTAVMLKGEAVWNMTVMFLRMWSVVSKDNNKIRYSDYMVNWNLEGAVSAKGFVQPFEDSPLDKETVSENIYLNIINKAKKYVYICTPYLIIDNEMITALTLAAKSGLDVRIMTPGIPDKKLVFLLTQSYYEELLAAGVKIYAYQPGFLHAKSFVCDDEIAVVGTINLDYRSLYLHFEDGVWMYDCPVINDIKGDFMESLSLCSEITLDFCRGRPWPVRAMQGLMRLCAPVL